MKSWQKKKSISHTLCKGISLQERRNASSLVGSNLAYSSTCLSWYWPPDLGSLSNIQSKYCEICQNLIMQDKKDDVMSNKQCTNNREARIRVLWMRGFWLYHVHNDLWTTHTFIWHSACLLSVMSMVVHGYDSERLLTDWLGLALIFTGSWIAWARNKPKGDKCFQCDTADWWLMSPQGH